MCDGYSPVTVLISNFYVHVYVPIHKHIASKLQNNYYDRGVGDTYSQKMWGRELIPTPPPNHLCAHDNSCYCQLSIKF